MSVIKIEQDIKLFEEKLEEINTTIADPIERNEYKKELQRKIKKLNRTKNSLELLQKEQQDLESLKSEVSTVKEKHENKFYIQSDKKSVDKPRLKARNNNRTVDKQRETNWQVSEIEKTDDWDVEPDETVDNDWGIPSNARSNNWQDDSCILISDNTEVREHLEDTAQIQEDASSTQITHEVYLSRRAIWVSTVFALLNFIIPYIYTRRWKPLCIVFISLIFFESLLLEEDIFVAAPLISAIDNGIAINKYKSKSKQKAS